MAFPVTINGRTYTLADFEGTNYVDGFPDALEDFVTQAGDIYNSTSTSSVAIGTGSKSFTTADSDKPYQPGTPLRIADAAAPATNFMDCIVTSYSGTSLVVDSIGFGGSGTKSSWTINIGGAKTVDGTLAVNQGGTGATTASAARTNLDVYSKTEADNKFLDVSGEASAVTINGTLTANSTTSLDGAVVINESGADVDFRVESDNNANMLFVDAGNDSVCIGTNSTNNTTQLKLDRGGASSGDQGPRIYLGRDSLSGASLSAGDVLNTIDFRTNSSSRGYSIQQESGTGTTSSSLKFQFYTDGSNKELLGMHGISAREVVVNEDSDDIDFRVESDNNANMLFVDAGNDAVGIGGVGLSSYSLTVDSSGDSLRVNAGSGGRAISIGGSGVFQIDASGSIGGRVSVGEGTDETVFNNVGANKDFRVESDANAHMLFVDADQNRVGINDSSPDATLDVGGNIIADEQVLSFDDNKQSTLLATGFTPAFRHAAPNVPTGSTSYVTHVGGTCAVSGQGYVSHSYFGTKRNGTASWNTGAFIAYGGNDGGPTKEWTFTLQGTFNSPSTKNFKIKHPLPELSETHALCHAAIEGPNADLIYRGTVDLVAGRAEVNIDQIARMTEGTFVTLTKDAQSFTSNESDWTAVRGSVSGNILTIEAQDSSSTASVSWMVVAKRNDPDVIDEDTTDDSGEFITEREEAN